MDLALRQQAGDVLDVLSRAQKLFGGAPASLPPRFVLPPDLETGLQRGPVG